MTRKRTRTQINPGDTVKVTRSTGCGPYLQASDKLFTVDKLHESKGYFYLIEYPNDGDYFQSRDFEVVAVTKEQILLQVEELETTFIAAKDILVAKLAFLEATGNSIYSVNEFKVWSVLQELKTASDDVTKSKLIAKIIEN